MLKIETVNNKEIVISIDYHKYIKKTKISLLLWLILPSIMIILNVTPFFLLIVTELFILVTFTISYYHFKKYNIILEKLIVKENSLVIQNINDDKKIIFNEEIKIDEIKEIFFKDELGVYFSCGGGLGDKRKFLKIKTSYKIFSFGILIEIEEYKKIRAVIKEKLKI